MPEEQFWETMTPARLVALYDAHFAPAARSVPTVGTNKDGEPLGLYSAIMEMGGT